MYIYCDMFKKKNKKEPLLNWCSKNVFKFLLRLSRHISINNFANKNDRKPCFDILYRGNYLIQKYLR